MPPLSRFQHTCLALAIGQVLALPAQAAVITVNSAEGQPINNGQCGLHEAIINANNDNQSGSLNCAGGNGADVIEFDLNLPATIPLTAATPTISTPITIDGPGPALLTIQGGPELRGFFISDTGANNSAINSLTITGSSVSAGAVYIKYANNVMLSDVVLSGNSAVRGGGINAYKSDSLSIHNSTISGNTAGTDSGGISAYETDYLSIQNSTLSGNSAGIDGGGISLGQSKYVNIQNTSISGNMAGSDGGGIYIYDVNYWSMLSITVSNNFAGNEGGGIWALEPDLLEISNSTLSGNSSLADGGAIQAINADNLSIISSTLAGNSSLEDGGAIHAYNSDSLSIISSTLSGNTASENGGGISISSSYSLSIRNSTVSGNSAEFGGGGVFGSDDSTINTTNSTVSGNSADNGGGFLVNDSTDLIITNSTLTKNSANSSGGGVSSRDGAYVSLANSILSGNTATAFHEFYNYLSTVTADAGNLFGHAGVSDAQAFFNLVPGASDINATTDGANVPLTSIFDTTLAANGGPTVTHALVPGSPAIDAGDNTDCGTDKIIDIDQRGIFRNDGACDIGAYEFTEEMCFVVQSNSGSTIVFCL